MGMGGGERGRGVVDSHMKRIITYFRANCFRVPRGNLGKLWILRRRDLQLLQSCYRVPRGTLESSGFSEDGSFNYFRAVSGFQGGPWKALGSQKIGRDLQLLRSCFGLPRENLGELWILSRRKPSIISELFRASKRKPLYSCGL